MSRKGLLLAYRKRKVFCARAFYVAVPVLRPPRSLSLYRCAVKTSLMLDLHDLAGAGEKHFRALGATLLDNPKPGTAEVFAATPSALPASSDGKPGGSAGRRARSRGL